MIVGFVVTARMKSTRLEKKATLEIYNRPLISWMIDRIKLCDDLDHIIIATSTNPQDNVLEDIARKENIECFRGSEDDVAARLYEAAVKYKLDFFVNITADCPLFSYDYVDELISHYKNTQADLITSKKLPHGLYIYGVKTEALGKVIELKKVTNTEVWGAFFYDRPDLFNVIDLPLPDSLSRSNYRLTIDYPEDFDFFKKLFELLGKDTYKKTTQEIIDCLDQHPETAEINWKCEELYQKKWDQQRDEMTNSSSD